MDGLVLVATGFWILDFLVFLVFGLFVDTKLSHPTGLVVTSSLKREPV